jgi:hypothetical protein
MSDPRETAVQCLQEVRTLLAQVEPVPDTPVHAAIAQAMARIAETLGPLPEVQQ